MSELTDFEKEAKADIKEAQEATAAEKANKPWFKRLSLTTWIFIALALGVVAGGGAALHIVRERRKFFRNAGGGFVDNSHDKSLQYSVLKMRFAFPGRGPRFRAALAGWGGVALRCGPAEVSGGGHSSAASAAVRPASKSFSFSSSVLLRSLE